MGWEKWIKRLLGFITLATTLTLITACVWWKWRQASRPKREDLTQSLFTGVTYHRMTRESPNKLLIHVVEINILMNPIKEMVITPPDHSRGLEHRAMTTSAFARIQDTDLATNGSYFRPFHSNTPFDYYPHNGDPVDIFSTAVYDGKQYSKKEEYGNRHILCWQNQGLIIVPDGEIPEGVEFAIPGGIQLIRNGELWKEGPKHQRMYTPRTAIGWNMNQSIVWLVTVDGRQEDYSKGMLVIELASLMKELGAFNSLALDGGGSSTLVAKVEGKQRVLNAPFHTRVPMRERPVANHLGFRLSQR